VILGVHHVSFSVGDLARARRFYGEVLGLAEIERPDLGLPGVWYRAGASEVHLIARPAGADVGSPPRGLSPLANHQAFGIEDYGRTLAWLRSQGVEVLETSPENGQMWVRDPDGNVLELIAPRARA
jgi:catechol 2,3-dioxygenase-like lactoylglutathione lyase family enzyme